MVISATGEKLGIMSAREANKIADEAELDLVKISPNAVPPVCKSWTMANLCLTKLREKKSKRRTKRL